MQRIGRLNTYHLNKQHYDAYYAEAKTNPDEFWGTQANLFLSWFSPWQQVRQGDFSTEINWFTAGKINACYNCIDRHLPERQDQVAIIYEGNQPDQSQHLTYQELYEQICRFANVLKSYGLKSGDRVCIYLPMIPQAVIAMLACARLGAIHTVVFAGFSADALATRILDTQCTMLITADESFRGDKCIPLKTNVDLACLQCPTIKQIFVVQHSGGPIAWQAGRDVWYHEAISSADTYCPCAIMDSADPLFILYTSGSTGKPKGVVHSTAGYLLYVAMTYYYVFDYREKDIHWCTADVGWITGHSYVVYGPLLNGGTTLLYEGVPHYPSYARFWQIIDKHQVNVFYTAPTALRSLRREGDQWLKETKRTSLKLLGTVGEPINPEVWQWYFDVVGHKRCPIVNTWWQTETGGVMITPLPGATPPLAGSTGWPFLGIEADIIDDEGHSLPPNQEGKLVIKTPWPGLMQTIYGETQRYRHYFIPMDSQQSLCYLTGDRAHRDFDNQFWLSGREDDVIKVSGHRLGTAEIESALVSHPLVAEAAVVSIPHRIKGEGIYAFVTLKTDVAPTEQLKAALIQQVRDKIGPIATPEIVQLTPALPKTRSGKIMRRILRQIANRDFDNLGDISTLADSSIIDQMIKDIK